MTNSDYILQLVRNALDNESKTSMKLSNCKRLAMMRADYENLWWIEYEMHDCEQLKEIAKQYCWRFDKDKVHELGPKYSSKWLEERQVNEYDTDCNVIRSDNVIAISVSSIEARLRSVQRQPSALPKTDNMHMLDVYFTEKENFKSRLFISKCMEDLETVLNRIRTRLNDYLISTEAELMKGNNLSSYFEHNKQFVSKKLIDIDATFKQELDQIDFHMESNTQIDYSESLLDIRRVLLHFANIVCPPASEMQTGSDGKKHDLSESKYLNRIEFVLFEKAGKHTSTELINGSLSDLCVRLEKINELSCKGVHSNVGQEETFMCIAQMYLLLGELIRILI